MELKSEHCDMVSSPCNLEMSDHFRWGPALYGGAKHNHGRNVLHSQIAMLFLLAAPDLGDLVVKGE